MSNSNNDNNDKLIMAVAGENTFAKGALLEITRLFNTRGQGLVLKTLYEKRMRELVLIELVQITNTEQRRDFIRLLTRLHTGEYPE